MPGRHSKRSVRHNEIFNNKLTQIRLTYDSYGVPYIFVRTVPLSYYGPQCKTRLIYHVFCLKQRIVQQGKACRNMILITKHSFKVTCSTSQHEKFYKERNAVECTSMKVSILKSRVLCQGTGRSHSERNAVE